MLSFLSWITPRVAVVSCRPCSYPHADKINLSCFSFISFLIELLKKGAANVEMSRETVQCSVTSFIISCNNAPPSFSELVCQRVMASFRSYNSGHLAAAVTTC